MDLGILPGTRIEVEMRSPLGDPTAYRVRGSVIALRRRQAQNIVIRLLPNKEE
jgi:Fe2+ transport system protein FeoA